MKYKNRYYQLLIGIIFVLGIYLLLVFPPSGDDFNRLLYLDMSFGEIIKEALGTHQYLNGRILGNGLSFLFISRSSRVLIKFSLILGIILSIGKITAREFYSFIFTILTLMFLDLTIFREDIVWNAGFFNYLPPVFLILILAYLSVTMRESLKKYILILVLTFASCLFMENISIYMLFFPFLLYFIYGISRKNVLYIFIASLLGNIAMFSSPIYLKIFTKKDSYRALADGGIIESVKNNWKVFQKYLSLGSHILHIFILLILIYMTYKFLMGKQYKSMAIGILGIVSSIGIVLTKSGEALIINLILHILYYGVLLFMAYGLEERYKKICLFACLSMAISMGPLLFISPVGARNFFGSYILNLLIFLSLFFGNNIEIKDSRIYMVILIIIILRQGFLSYIYTINWNDYKKVESYVKESAENNVRSISIEGYTYPDYIHDQTFDKLVNFYYEKEGHKNPIF